MLIHISRLDVPCPIIAGRDVSPGREAPPKSPAYFYREMHYTAVLPRFRFVSRSNPMMPRKAVPSCPWRTSQKS